MALAFDAAVDGGNNGGTTTTRTWSHTCAGSNRLLVVCFAGDTTLDDVSSVTYAGVSMTLVAKVHITSDRWEYMYYLVGPASGANNVVVTVGSNHYIIGTSASWTGARQSSQPDASTTHIGSSSPITTSVITLSNNCTVVLGVYSFTTLTASTGSTSRVVDAAFSAQGIFEYSSAPKTPAGSVSMSTTYSGVNGGHVMASFAPLDTTTLKTIAGIARITITTLRTIPGVARITTAGVLKTIAGIARITVAAVQRTITGIAKITATTLRTIPGVARIQQTVLQTISGIARITASTLRTINGVARVTVTVLQTIPGVGRITAITLRTISGIAKITATTTRTITGVARVTATTLRTITGVANITPPTITTLKTIPGVARITAIVLRLIAGVARVQATTLRTISGVAKIEYIHTQQTITGVARIFRAAEPIPYHLQGGGGQDFWQTHDFPEIT